MLTLQNPYVKRDPTMHEFLTSAQFDKEWDELKKSALVDSKVPWLERSSCRHWRFYLTNCLDLPNDAGEVLDGLWASVSTQLAVVANCLSSLSGVDQKQRALAVAINTAGEKAEKLGFLSSPSSVINEEKSPSSGERKSSVGNESEFEASAGDQSFVDADVDVDGAEQEQRCAAAAHVRHVKHSDLRR